MKIEKMNKLMKTLILISMAAVLMGALFKLQHYPHGDLLFWCGIWSNFILSSFEISRLREIIIKSNKTDHPAEL
ncbi:MAG TPA: hypothetical protein VGK10_17715 [Prolixibacteraceae bacterium]|jgi:hypothetical protein